MSSTLLLPPREQLCNRSCSNKTHTATHTAEAYRSEPGETSAVTSAVGGSPLPESLSGPCRRLRYHELNTHKVTKYNGRRHSALHERTVRLSRLVSFHAPSSYEPHAMPHDWPRVWPPYCSLMQVSWPTSCMHPHKRAPIAALRRRVPHPRNCRPSALEVILPLHYHSTPHVPVCAVR